MRVLSVAYPLLPVCAASAGGAEQVLFHVDRGLVANGHESLVVAAAGSKVSGRFLEGASAPGEITDDQLARARAVHRQVIERALREERIDCLHFHGLDYPEYLPETKIPVIATIHLPVDWYSANAFASRDVELVCVSHTQERTFRRPTTVIENGVDWRSLDRPEGNRDTLLWLGRICPEKGVHIALEAAHRSGAGLLLAGPVHPFRFHQDYYDRQVKPLLDAKRRHIGPVDLETKAGLLARAQALLVPSIVAETSSLVAMEALAAGTPVIAFRSGALPEVVEHGRSGWIVNSTDEMVDAIRHLNEINSQLCREIARTRFSADRMVCEYLALYRRMIRRERSCGIAPQDALYDSSPRRKSQAL